MKNTLTSTALIALSVVSHPVQSEIIFRDGFETADNSATNADGFTWGHGVRVAVVTQDPVDGPVKVYEQDDIYEIQSATMPDGTTRDWTAFEGDYSLRFRYPSIAEMESIGTEEWAEIRFDMGAPQRDLWISYRLKVPANWDHAAPNMHNKLLAIWQDGYIQYGEGTNFVWNYWPEYENSVRTGDSYLDGEFSTNFASLQGGLPEYHEGFLNGTADAGRWMQLVFHVKVSSTNTTPDGKAVAWRRWDGDTEFTKMSDWTGVVKTPTNGPDGFKAGYLLGWASAGIAVQTEFQIDNFTLSTSPLITNPITPQPPTLEAD